MEMCELARIDLKLQRSSVYLPKTAEFTYLSSPVFAKLLIATAGLSHRAGRWVPCKGTSHHWWPPWLKISRRNLPALVFCNIKACGKPLKSHLPHHSLPCSPLAMELTWQPVQLQYFPRTPKPARITHLEKQEHGKRLVGRQHGHAPGSSSDLGRRNPGCAALASYRNWILQPPWSRAAR